MSVYASRLGRRAIRRFVPQCEALEGRWCPSAIRIVDHTLIVRGDALADTITITDDGAGNVAATVSSAAGTISGTGSGINRILVDSGAGDDTVNLSLTGALGSDLAVLVHLGKGSDSANLDFSAGVANGHLNVGVSSGGGADRITSTFGTITNEAVEYVLALGAGSDTVGLNLGGAVTTSSVDAYVHGGYGADAVTANLGSVTDSNVALYAFLGRGADSFTGTLGGNVSGTSKVAIKALGGLGPDTFALHASGGVNISQDSTVYVLLRGGRNADNLSVDYEGVLSGKLNVETWGGSGADTITQNLTVDAGSTGKLIAREGGILGENNLTLNAFDNSGTPSTLADLDAVIFANHSDTIAHTPNVRVVFVHPV
jgi:hypothetical protein